MNSRTLWDVALPLVVCATLVLVLAPDTAQAYCRCGQCYRYVLEDRCRCAIIFCLRVKRSVTIDDIKEHDDADAAYGGFKRRYDGDDQYGGLAQRYDGAGQYGGLEKRLHGDDQYGVLVRRHDGADQYGELLHWDDQYGGGAKRGISTKALQRRGDSIILRNLVKRSVTERKPW